MGFNFTVSHPRTAFIEGFGDKVVEALRRSCGVNVPLGSLDEDFVLNEELAWSWWAELQQLALEKLGPAGSEQMQAVDAWMGVYVDADVDHFVLHLDRGPGTPSVRLVLTEVAVPWWRRILRTLGLARSADAELSAMQAELEGALPQNAELDDSALQVGNLRRLMAELNALLDALGIQRTEPSIIALRDSYLNDDDRIDSEGAIQCLCHAWLTAKHAIEHRAPMWLVK